jgi:hypothetical protein
MGQPNKPLQGPISIKQLPCAGLLHTLPTANSQLLLSAAPTAYCQLKTANSLTDFNRQRNPRQPKVPAHMANVISLTGIV